MPWLSATARSPKPGSNEMYDHREKAPMAPALHIDKKPDRLILHFAGRLDIHGIGTLWDSSTAAVRKAGGRKLSIDLTEVTAIDLAAATLITRLKTLNLSQGGEPEVLGLKKEFTALLSLARTDPDRQPDPVPGLSLVEQAGAGLAAIMEDARTFITFTGEIAWALAAGLKRPAMVRWADAFGVAESSGVNGLPIVLLISFIVGLVMAFQAAIPMKTFGAEIYVANLIGIAMVRELGPLMTAIVLAGRSASAFAAEIGTMKINEEIDALTVMGLDPVHFLIIPRVVAATLVTPLLTVFADLAGILGGAVVILSLGYPPVAYYNQVVGFVSWEDLTGGLVKCLIFGLIIAATGCIRGYQTQRSPSAVGDATTSAVVTSIILIAVFDGIFSVVYYYLGI